MPRFLVTRDSLLVTRDFPTPRRALRDTPRRRRWALARYRRGLSSPPLEGWRSSDRRGG